MNGFTDTFGSRSSFLSKTRIDEPVDVATANREVRQWLHDVAAQRVHATLKERPIDRFMHERTVLRPLPMPYGGHRGVGTPARLVVPTPVESIQHPLTVYDMLAKEISA